MQRIVFPSLLVWEYASVNKADRVLLSRGFQKLESDGREALSCRVGREGASDKVASEQRPSVSQGGGRAD